MRKLLKADRKWEKEKEGKIEMKIIEWKIWYK